MYAMYVIGICNTCESAYENSCNCVTLRMSANLIDPLWIEINRKLGLGPVLGDRMNETKKKQRNKDKNREI